MTPGEPTADPRDPIPLRGRVALVTGVRAVNTRSTILLTQAFAARHDGRPGSRVIAPRWPAT